jgi:hypothetical protein
MKSLSLLVASIVTFLFTGVSNTAMAQITVGTGTSTTSTNPISSCYGYSYSEQIYLQSEIGAGGNITTVSFYMNTKPSNTASSEDWTIYMGHTTKADYTSTTDWITSTGLTQVFTGTVSYPANGNWMTITLTTPFAYNNTDNLVIAVDENMAGYNCSVNWNYTSTSTNYRSIYYRSDATNPNPTAPPTGTRTYNRANVQLGGIIQACPPPSALAVSNVTTTSANLNWTIGGTTTAWDVEYGAAGFVQGTGTTVAATTNSYALSTLSTNTAYSYYVRANCGAGQTSAWVGPFSFSTPCVAFTVPYFEGFEAGYTNNTAVAGCLSQESVTGGGLWIANNTFTTYNRAPYTGAWNAFLQFGNQDWIYIPIDLTGGTSYTFGAYARQDGATATNSDVTISYGTANNATAMTNTIVATTGIINGNYQLLTGSFTPTTTGTYYIGIKGYMNGSPWYISLDDISVITTPSCDPPSALAVSAITSSGASLNWTENGTATTWDVEYGAAGFTQGAGTTVAVTAKPYALSTLSTNTAYSYYVRANCGAGQTSAWVGPFSFSTPCVAFTVPYFEGFEAGYTNNTAVAGCLSQESVTGGGLWIANNTFTTYNRAPYTGAWNAFLQFGNQDWIYIPIDLTGGTSYTFGAYARQDGATATNSDVTISYGTANNATAMTNTIVATTGIINGNYQLLTGSFTPTTTGTYYIGIKGYMNGSPWYISLDDISVIATPNCSAPNTLTASNIAATSADLAWVGTGASFEVQYGAAGFTLGTGMMATSATNTASVTGLTFETNYNFYVRAVCAPGDISLWSGVGSFFTGYCTPAPSLVDGIGITNVTMGGVNNTTGAETGNYGNYSAQVANATQGGTLPIDISLETSYTYDMWAWVDWNNDLDFTDAGEEFFLGTSVAANPTIFSSSIAIPATAALGNYRIRIGGADIGLGVTSPSLPCYTGTYAAFEDYTLNVDDSLGTTHVDYITSLSIYPNPTSGKTVIKLELFQNADVSFAIYTLVGVLVQDFGKENTSKATHIIDVSNYSAGMYLVRFVVDNQLVTKKLIVAE